MAKQVWYFEDSPVASLARKLPKGYAARPVARKEGPPGNGKAPQVWLADLAKDARSLQKLARSHNQIQVVYLARNNARLPQKDRQAFIYLTGRPSPAVLARTLDSAFDAIILVSQAAAAKTRLKRSMREVRELNRIGVALSSEKDPDKLLALILSASREITSSDAGALYVVEEVSETEKQLRFKLTQNDSLQIPFTEFTMPINKSSIAGYVADTGEELHLPDAYKIPSSSPFQFNKSFDTEVGYRTKSMLTIPLKNPKDEVLGVLQLINCKRKFSQKLASPKDFQKEVVAYDVNQIALAVSLASQAAVAYENTTLYENIQTLFEGFVKAAVTAIEQRDPTTSGHSFRVSQLTCGLAEAADKVDSGPYADLAFTREQMKEIRYAALLHDFGKVGVREEVLVKAKKLYPDQLNIVQHRFDYIRKALETDILKRKVELIQKGASAGALTELDAEFERRLGEVEDYMLFILESNEPTVMPEGNFDRLIEIAKLSYHDPRGIERPYLAPHEVRFLSIPKGSLDNEERKQIESHVLHTYNFLTHIPWTGDLKDVPNIARGHHEKLNGKGYPYNLNERDISPQTRMMTISDIFDALSASDRPYKKAVPVERALKILSFAVKDGELDPLLYQLFLDAKIFQLTTKS
jgi:HD-GYP domain-containing protein (c-di-GMP phosphodiesterase class II)